MCKFAGPAERACWAFAPFGMCVRRIVQNKLVAVSEQNGSLHSGYGAKCKQTRGRQQTQQRKSRSTGPRARLVSDAVARLGQYVQQSLDRTRQTPRCHQISTALINGDGSSSARSGHMTPKVQSEGLRATPSNAANTRTWCGLELVLHSTRFYASHRPGTSTRLRALAVVAPCGVIPLFHRRSGVSCLIQISESDRAQMPGAFKPPPTPQAPVRYACDKTLARPAPLLGSFTIGLFE